MFQSPKKAVIKGVKNYLAFIPSSANFDEITEVRVQKQYPSRQNFEKSRVIFLTFSFLPSISIYKNGKDPFRKEPSHFLESTFVQLTEGGSSVASVQIV